MIQLTSVERENKRDNSEVALVEEELQRVHGHGAEGGGLVVAVVDLMDPPVQVGTVEQAVEVVGQHLYPQEETRNGQDKVRDPLVVYTVV